MSPVVDAKKKMVASSRGSVLNNNDEGRKIPSDPKHVASTTKQRSNNVAARTSNQKTSTSSKSLQSSARSSRATPEVQERKSTPSADSTTTKKAAVKAHPLPSAALNKHKQAAVWTTGKKKHKTNFSSAYDAGSLPCRINHGSIRNALHWTQPVEDVSFNPLLITCVEGFHETEHPFVFLSRAMFRELMQQEDADEKLQPILPQVIVQLRSALMAKDEDIFLMALEATRLISEVVGGEMNTYLPKITQQIHRKLLSKSLRSAVEDTLMTLEQNGGREALSIIRSKIPTYTPSTF